MGIDQALMSVLGDLAGVGVTLKTRIATMIPATHTAKWEAVHGVEMLSGQVKKKYRALKLLFKYLTKGTRREKLGWLGSSNFVPWG